MSIYNFVLRLADPSKNPRKWHPGHVITIGEGNERRSNYWKVPTSGPTTGHRNLLTIQGMQAVQLRWLWKDINPTGNTFDFGPVKSSYADSERSIRADLWRCKQNDSRLIALITDKTFGGASATPENTDNPVPADMQDNPQYVQWCETVAPGGDGYSTCRWNPTVVSRWGAMIQALGDAFDKDPNWYGIGFQETAIGFSAAQRTATGYTDVKYRDAYISMLKTASDAFPTSQIFWYTNFMPIPAHDFRLAEVCDALKGYNKGNSGVNHGGPDIMPDNDPLVTRVYPRYGDPPDGSFGELKLFCSAQFSSYAHEHTTNAPPDARLPGETWTSGTLWTMQHIYMFGRDNLRLNHIMWENDTSGSQQFEPDVRLIIEANPRFNEDY